MHWIDWTIVGLYLGATMEGSNPMAILSPSAMLIVLGGTLGAVIIGTRPETAEATMRECVELGIKQVWMHRLYGSGSVSNVATVYGRQHGITVIDGGCPLMFDPTADLGHKAMRFVFTRTGKVPRQV